MSGMVGVVCLFCVVGMASFFALMELGLRMTRIIAVGGSGLTLLTWALVGATHLGYSQRDNSLVGQVKYITRATPLLCPEFTTVSLSLGVVRGDTGSNSTHDAKLYVPTAELAEQLKIALESGKPVKITADEYRATMCVPEDVVTRVEVLP